MKISIITATWKREKLFRIFLNSVKRYFQDYGIQTMVAGSEGVHSREMCLDAGAGYVEAPNVPLSGKFNKALLAAQANYRPDAFMILGSDDFVNHEVIERYLLSLEQGFDIVGFKDCYYYDGKSKEAWFWGGYSVKHRQGESIGMARLLSRKVFEKLRGRFWTQGNAGLDWLMSQRLKKHRDLKRQTLTVTEGGYVILDVKGHGNISSLGSYDLEKIDKGVFNTIPEFSLIEKL